MVISYLLLFQLYFDGIFTCINSGIGYANLLLKIVLYNNLHIYNTYFTKFHNKEKTLNTF